MIMTSDPLHNTSVAVLHPQRADSKNKSDLKAGGCYLNRQHFWVANS